MYYILYNTHKIQLSYLLRHLSISNLNSCGTFIDKAQNLKKKIIFGNNNNKIQ